MTRRTIWILGCVLLLCGCSQKKTEEQQPASGLTESQRDSVIAHSKLPGADVMGRALAVSDSAEARAKRMDEAN